MVQGVGFEPTKALPPELKSGPFDHSGTPAAHGRTNLVLNRAALICPKIDADAELMMRTI